ILERSDPGSRFPLVGARDLDIGSNSIQAYSIFPENEYFSVSYGSRSENDRSVELTLEKPLDREEQPELSFTVIAVDGGSPPRSGTTQVNIIVLDVNDNAPVFTQKIYVGQVLENSPEGSAVLTVVAADRDLGVNGEITYEFSKEMSQTDNPFTIDSMSGEIKLTKPLDFETANTQEVTVTATDGGGLSAICKVLVETFSVDISDVNDNAPVFNQTSYTMYVRENNVPSVFVGAVSAADADVGLNAKVTYSLAPVAAAERPSCSCISVNSESGHVFVLRPLDYERLRQTQVTVSASDAGSPPLRANVTVRLVVLDENDNAPLVLYPGQESSPASTELVPVSAEAGYLITKVVAVDADSGQNSWLSY
ncbi:PCDBC protein, partial [Hippolais icterina]|nr:PCDBC protein [Hippolais icterina]